MLAWRSSNENLTGTNMSDEREKSLKEKQYEDAIGIGDALKQLDMDETNQVSKEDDEKRRKLEDRKKYIADMKQDFDLMKKKPDLEFSADIYKELVMIDMEMLRITRKEMELDPQPRYVETAGSLTAAITSTLDSLRDIDNTKFDQGMEKEKLEIKKNQGAAAPGANIVMIGSMQDILKQAKLEMKTIDAEVVIEKEEDKKEVK